jgi:hypothetical protein
VLSIHRLAVTTATAAALAAPAAQAEPIDVPQRSTDTKIDLVTPDARLGVPQPATGRIDRVSPDARDQRRVDVPAVPRTRIVEMPANDGFEWGDAAIGGAAVLAVVLLISGGAMTVRPHRAPAASR